MRLTEEQVRQSLTNMGERYAPLTINSLTEQTSGPDGCKVDVLIEFSIRNGPFFTAIVEIKTVATPQ
ncbi:MAG: hypothetical protein PVJ86_10735, partial [Phycisphaerales bacterium]